jgi:molybdopterin-guanine dinucleotide biosynthesis protein A
MTINSIEAFILTGGASRRMGTDKSQLLIDGQTFTARIAETLLKLTDSVSVVGREAGSSLRSVGDVYPQWGALGGLHAALSACTREWAIVVACDLPFVTAELFSFLAEKRLDHETIWDTVVPVQEDGRPQPLAALYRVKPCRQRATELIDAGRRRPLDLLEAVKTRWVSFAEIRNLDQAERFFVNINTPSDYYEATRSGPDTPI